MSEAPTIAAWMPDDVRAEVGEQIRRLRLWQDVARGREDRYTVEALDVFIMKLAETGYCSPHVLEIARRFVADDAEPEWGPDSADQELERGPR
jgi:hypothetical protein